MLWHGCMDVLWSNFKQEGASSFAAAVVVVSSGDHVGTLPLLLNRSVESLPISKIPPKYPQLLIRLHLQTKCTVFVLLGTFCRHKYGIIILKSVSTEPFNLLTLGQIDINESWIWFCSLMFWDLELCLCFHQTSLAERERVRELTYCGGLAQALKENSGNSALTRVHKFWL